VRSSSSFNPRLMRMNLSRKQGVSNTWGPVTAPPRFYVSLRYTRQPMTGNVTSG
jgi:hypothetical protein